MTIFSVKDFDFYPTDFLLSINNVWTIRLLPVSPPCLTPVEKQQNAWISLKFPHLPSFSGVLFVSVHHKTSSPLCLFPPMLFKRQLPYSVNVCVIIYRLVNGERQHETQSLASTLLLSATPKSPLSLAYFHIHGVHVCVCVCERERVRDKNGVWHMLTEEIKHNFCIF